MEATFQDLKALAESMTAAANALGSLKPAQEVYQVPLEDKVATLKVLRESETPDTHISEEIHDLAESIQWEDPKTSFKDIRTLATRNYRELREANPVQAFGQLLRAGIQTIANSWYQRPNVNYPNYVQEVPSDKRQEFYAPLHGSAFPRRTGRGEPYRTQRAKGEDREVINYKYMGGEDFERELFDDDQTGQIRTRASQLGKSMRLLEENYVAGRFIGTAFTVGDDTYPASIFSTTNAVGTAITTPFNVNMYTTSQGNRPATFTQLTFPAMKTGITALLNALDPLNVKIAAMPDTVLVSSQDFVNVRTFLNSTYYPSPLGLGTDTGGAPSPGVAGGTFSQNPINGMLQAQENIFLPAWAWAMGEARKGMIFQRRDPMEIIQENPQAGESFQTDTYRFRSRSRWEAEWIDSRFWFLGNDGTITGVQ